MLKKIKLHIKKKQKINYKNLTDSERKIIPAGYKNESQIKYI